MTKKEAADLLAILLTAYPNYYKNASANEAQGVITLWSMQFADLPAEIVYMALNKHIATNKFPPTIAEIKDKISSMHWEAYDKLYFNLAAQLTEQEEQMYKSIYEATEGYKFQSRIEPTVEQMMGGGTRMLLPEGE